MSLLTRARALELWDRARLDALGLVGSVAKHTLPQGELADRVFAALVHRRPPPRHRMLPLLETFARLHEDAFFVQIGANDGEQQDHLRDLVLAHRWAGIMVEPVPYVFERLRRNHGETPGITLENVAIGAEDGEATFYHLAQADDAGRPGLPTWFDALGSMRKDVILAHERFIPDIAERIVETKVPAITFESLCSRHRIDHVDLLLTDTEGYDFEILKRIDFERIRPTFIIYEHQHLSVEDQAACLTLLGRFGYKTVDYGLDTWCLNPAVLTEGERREMLPIWWWIEEARERQRPLLPTRVVRAVGRRVVGGGAVEQAGGELLPLSDSERHYLVRGYDDRVPLPAGAAGALSEDSPRLVDLRRRYAQLDLPAVQHHMWSAERVAEHVELRYFRGDNLYLWHYPEHPRAMALTLFLYMRYLEGRGGRELLEKLSEDGLFGCWTADVDGYGKLSRDLLDSVSEILFLERNWGLLGRERLRVLDIGAGYGRLAHRLSSVHPSLVDYCCTDAVPESTFLSEYYLGFRGCTPPARVAALDEVQALEPGSFDIAFNIHSFSECTLAAIEWWVGQLARLEVPYLFVVPNEAEGLISREVGGGYHDALPTLAAAGYEPVHQERAIDDAGVRQMTRIHDNHYLFARPGAPKR